MVELGIDVSKAKLDCTLLLDVDTLRGRSKSVPNTPEGVKVLLQWVERHSACTSEQVRAVLELTGVYHEAAALALYEVGVQVLVVNPARPGRVEPRVVKRRPKQYMRMTRPRAVLRKQLPMKGF